MSNAPAPPSVAATEYFYLCSAVSAPGFPLGLALDENNNVTLQPWGGGQLSELWMLVDNGPTFSLVSAKSTAETTWYLALSGSNEAIVQTSAWGWVLPEQWNNTDASTLPNYQTAGTIQTDNGTAALQAAAAGAAITAATPDGSAGQTWSIFPQVAARQEPRPQWTRIQSGLTDDEGNLYVLDLTDGGSNPILANVVVALPSSSPSQFWQFTPDGALLNGIGGGLCAVPTDGNSDSGYTKMFLSPWAPATSETADGGTWGSSGGAIVLTQVGGSPALALDAGDRVSPGATVAVTPYDPSSPTPGQQFTLVPTQTLPSILAQAPTAFPQYTSGDEGTCYAYVNQQLGLTSQGTELRAQYLNLVQTFSDWRTSILDLAAPAGLSDPGVWTTVQGQLATELEYVEGVVNLFNNYWMYHSQLEQSMQGWLPDLVSEAEADENVSANGFAVSFVEGVFREFVRAVPGGSAIMSIGTAALGAATAAQAVTGDSFTADVQDLWSSLSGSFVAVLTQAGLSQTAILTDWGKLSAVGQLLSTSLAWPDMQIGDLVNSAQPGFTFSVMQLLLPARFQIYTYQEDSDDPVRDVDSWAQSVVQDGFGGYQASWIAERDDWDDEPGEKAMNDATGNQPGGGSWFNDTLSPWPFAVCWCKSYNNAGSTNAVTTVTNQSVRPMRMTMTADSQGSQSVILYPYSSASQLVPIDTDGEAGATFTITDAVSGAQLASFEVGEDSIIGPGGTPFVGNISVAPGYALTTPQCNQAATDDDYPGTVQITITTT